MKDKVKARNPEYSRLRKAVLFFGLLFLGVSGANAQKLQIGLNFTPQLSWFQSNMPSQVRTTGNSFGYDVGLQFRYFFRENYALTGGIKILHAGGEVAYVDTVILQAGGRALTVPAATPVGYSNEYVHVPVGIHLQSVEIGYFTFYFETGLSLLFRFNTWVNVDGITDAKVNGDEDMNLFNLAYFAVLGFQYSLGGKTSLAAGVSYIHGLMDITKDTGGKPDDRLIFHSLGLRMGINF